MTLPLILLAIATIFVGFIPFNELVTSDGGLLHIHMHWDIALASIAIGLVGIIIALIFYKKKNNWSNKLEKSFGSFYTYALNKFYFDELYIFVTKKIIFKRIATPIAWLDRNIINASVDGIATATNYCSDKIKGMQSGQVQDYLTAMLVSIIVLVFIVIYFII